MPIDYKRYPPNWLTEIVPAILQRAGHACENCGLVNGTSVFSIRLEVRDEGRYKLKSIWFSRYQDALRECPISREVKTVKVVLTVAHFDHDEENHSVSLDRLKALCQICHLRYDAKEKYRRSEEKWKNTQRHPQPYS